IGQVLNARARSHLPLESSEHRKGGAHMAVDPSASGPTESRSSISWKLVIVLFTVLLPGSHFIFCDWAQGA
uniref:Uncharacterized protein n=1 Tax=Phocoena sinus TaxID=42100 RepID=A0A8C9CNT9_PHOSS